MKLNEAFQALNSVDCSEHTEKKNGLTYLSWAWAWLIFKLNFPASFYTVYEDADGNNYHSDGQTAWVKTGVTLVADDGQLELIEMLPVMDYKNKSIRVDTPAFTSFEVNKAIQRSLTKALARHGLGLYIYAGEDLPSLPCDGEQELDFSAPVEKKEGAALITEGAIVTPAANVKPKKEKKAKVPEAPVETEIPESMQSEDKDKAKALSELWGKMVSADVADVGLLKVVINGKGYYDVTVDPRDYDIEFINGVLIGAWDQVLSAILTEKNNLPF